MTPQAPGPTKAIATFVAAHRADDLPDAVRHEGRRALVNGIAAALGAVSRPEMTQGLAAFAALGVNGPCRVIGSGQRTDMLGAAFLNAVAINALDFDDTHMPTVIHPTAPVAGAVLAFAERRTVTGAAALHAFVLGVEIACRLGNAVHPSHYANGFHITATCGAVGAAVAVAKLIGLDASRTAHAIGLAATQAGGLVESLPTMAKSASVGGAARNGLLAASLADAGWDAPPASIEGRFGFANVMAETFDAQALVGELGARWETRRNDYKPYPCGIVLHPVLDGCLDLRASGRVSSGAIASIEVRGSTLLGQRADRGVVSVGNLAKLSIHHACAIAFLRGAAGVAEFSDDAARDPAVQALAARVRFVEDAAMGAGSVRIVAVTSDGTRHEYDVPHARGSAARPMTDAELDAKLALLARDAGAWCDGAAIARALWSIDTLPDAAQVMRLLSPG